MSTHPSIPLRDTRCDDDYYFRFINTTIIILIIIFMIGVVVAAAAAVTARTVQPEVRVVVLLQRLHAD